MNIALFRREHLHSENVQVVGEATADQFQRTHAAIGAWSEVEHTDDGHHGHVTAESLDVAGDATIHGDATIDGDTVIGGKATLGGDLDVAGDAAIHGDARVDADLIVFGDASVSGTLVVGGETTLNTVGGNTTILGALDVAQATMLRGDVSLAKGTPRLELFDTGQPADQRRFRLRNVSQQLVIDAQNDAETATSGTVTVTRGGDVSASRDYYEKNRAVPMGHWQAFTPVFTPDAGTATVTTTYACGYTFIGKTMIVAFRGIVAFSSTPTSVIFAVPGGVVCSGYFATPVADAVGTGVVQSIAGDTNLVLYRNLAASEAWAAGDHNMGFSFAFQIN